MSKATQQEKLDISDFFGTDFVNFSSYDNLRKIASVVDGQKNASRKVLHTILNHSITSDIKVSSLGSRVSEFTEYLHGNMDGVTVGLAQNFPGSNNIPLLVREGNFGTRFDNSASASRYIFTHGSSEFFELFDKKDSPILKNQSFEGTQIEPMFFVPKLPMLLVNGSNGVSSGFAQNILPRNPKDIIKYLKVKLSGKGRLPKLEPWYAGFAGTVEQGVTDKQWVINGVVKRVGTNRIQVSEIPVGIGLVDYIKVLDKLEDDKIITTYKDLSEDNKFLFEVRMTSKFLASLSDEELLDKLKLTKRVSENFTVMDENNKILVLDSAEEAIEHYIKIKLEYLGYTKDHTLNELLNDISIEESRYAFISAIIKETLKINKRPKKDIEQDLLSIPKVIKQNNSFDYLLNMAIHSLTEERLIRLEKIIKSKKDEYSILKESNIETIWINDLDSLKL